LDIDENGGEVRGRGMMLEVKQCPGRFLGITGEIIVFLSPTSYML
jgi:hypothetical protein